MYLLSICIARLPHRVGGQYYSFIDKIKASKPSWVEIIEDWTEDISIGEKRNRMIDKASGKYICQLDDDQDITKDYFYEIKKGIDKNVDVVCIAYDHFINGEYSHTIHYGWKNPHGINNASSGHFCPVRSEILKNVKYQNAGRNEDTAHQLAIQPYLEKAYYIKESILLNYYREIPKEYDNWPKAELCINYEGLPKI